ncbi:AraC family transcriptional regulator [Apibacter raozihei]|uniref:helix-turn-helix transcriptional regulator n=1 Tax=Apibacter raozihei TaxID=2500547 RepID=UPI000FE41B9C|nr:AraC family transcriptional regulator [Apibacter raozihei]
MDLKNTFKSRIRENKIGKDIYLAQIDNYTIFTDTISKPVGKRFIQFYFCTKGRATFHFENKDQYLMKEGYSLLLFNSEIDIPINISLAKKSKLIIFVITLNKMEEIFTGFEDKLPFHESLTARTLYKEKLLSVPEKLIITQLENFSLDSDFENMYLSLKLHELLLHYFSVTDPITEKNKTLKDEKFLEQLQEIKELLLENITHPPTLNDLSLQFNLSEYKIKEGFKKYYGKTLSHFLLDTKMEIGKEKLDLKVKQVQEIAHDLGYENPSHFIEAFKKKYGITPKQWMMK